MEHPFKTSRERLICGQREPLFGSPVRHGKFPTVLGQPRGPQCGRRSELENWRAAMPYELFEADDGVIHKHCQKDRAPRECPRQSLPWMRMRTATLEPEVGAVGIA